jgi:hypothetical protein
VRAAPRGTDAGPPPEGWTARSALQRGRAVLREEGLRSLFMRVLGETVYRRMLVLRGTLSDAPPQMEPNGGVEFRPLERFEIEQYLQLRPDQTMEEIERRLASGQVCFAAREDGRLVQACWLAPPGAARIEYLDLEFPLSPVEVYVHDFFAAPSERGRYLFRAQLGEMAAYFSDHEQRQRWFPHHVGPTNARYGYAAAFHLENRIWTLIARLGLPPRDIVGYIGFGRMRWRFCRPAPSEERLRRAVRSRTLRRRRRRRRERGPVSWHQPSPARTPVPAERSRTAWRPP